MIFLVRPGARASRTGRKIEGQGRIERIATPFARAFTGSPAGVSYETTGSLPTTASGRLSVRAGAEAEPAGAAIRPRPGSASSYQQARAFSCPGHAGRGSLGRGQGVRPIPRILPAYPRPSRPSDRSGRGGAQARRPVLASPHQERRFRPGCRRRPHSVAVPSRRHRHRIRRGATTPPSPQPQTWNVPVRNNRDLNALGATYEHATRSRYITVWLE